MEKAKSLLKNKKLMAVLGFGAVLLFLLLFPVIVSSKYVLFLMVQVFINIIVVSGLNIIAGLTGQNHSATGAIFSIGAYISAILTTKYSVSPWLALLVSILAGAIIGIVIGYPSLKLNSTFLWLVTAAFCEVVTLLERNLVELTGGTQGIKKIPYFSLFGFRFKEKKYIYYLYLVFAIAIILLTVRITSSRWGRVLRAVRDNEESMRSSGINDTSMKILAFTISAIFCSFAGSLYAHSYNYVTPTAFQAISTNYLIMIMIGGFSSVPGSILGAILITLLPEQLRFLEGYSTMIFSTVTLIMALFMPKGLISLFDLTGEDSPIVKIRRKIKERKEKGETK